MSEVAGASSLNWYYQMKDQMEIRAPIEDRWFSFTRGLEEHPTGESHKFDYLVEHFVDEITSEYDQDVSLLMVGNKGRGKSLCALSMSYYAGCELAERLGGKWQDYFDPDRNMAVILEEEANAVMAIQDKYQIKDYDDIGIGWGARNWQQQENKDKNDVFQINRTDNTLQIFSVPNQFLLDKVPRSLVSHYAEMDQQFFAHGFTTIKMFKPQTLFREGKIIQPYLHMDRTKYVLFRIPKPPDDLVEYYKKRRRENKNRATKKRMEGDTDPVPAKKIKLHPAVLEMQRAIQEQHGTDIMRVLTAGGSKEDVAEMLHKQKGVANASIKRWYTSGAMKRLGFEPDKK